jgi:Flp pilus assembly pilin Flp
MRHLLRRLWDDDSGALLATEWIIIATILVLGIITGLVATRAAVLAELIDFANALVSLNQSFSLSGQSNCLSSVAGSSFTDATDSITNRSISASLGSPAVGVACD